jgi:hypothetical protein
MNNDIKTAFTDAVRYWEKKRIAYNVVMALIVIGHFIYFLPDSANIFELDPLLMLFVLAVLANILYCSAYIADIFLQMTEFAEVWRNYRWTLLTVGFILAAIITRFISINMFDPV